MEWFRSFLGEEYSVSFSDHDTDGFFSEERAWLVDDVAIYVADQQPFTQWRGSISSDSEVERLNMLAVESGYGHFSSGDASSAFGSGDIIVTTRSLPTHLRRMVRTRGLGFTMPLSKLGISPDEISLRPVLAADDPSTRGLILCLRTFKDALERDDHETARFLVPGLVAILQSTIRRSGRNPDFQDVETLKRFAIQKFIEDNLTNPVLNPEVLGNTFGLSRASLYRLFEPVGGVSNFIRNTRLDRAYAHLSGTADRADRPTVLAHELGFYDSAHFSKHFKARFGLSPRGLVNFCPRTEVGKFSSKHRILTEWSFGELFAAGNESTGDGALESA